MNVRGFVSFLAQPAVPFSPFQAFGLSPSWFELELPSSPPVQMPVSGHSGRVYLRLGVYITDVHIHP